MPVSWQDVYSEVADKVGYDSDTQTLLVQWKKGGKVSAYHDVPPHVAEQAANAYSVGNFIHENIKPNHKHKYLDK